MKDKNEIINELIEQNGYKNYLELGSQTGYNFNKIKCKNKTSVDLDHKADFKGTTDDFFAQNETVYDCIFVDADHTSQQCRKDIINAMKCLTPEGVIILHDCLPPTKGHQIVPRQQREWCGTVWRACVGFIKKYPDCRVETYRSDYGLCCIYPGGKKYKAKFVDEETTFNEFKSNEVELLNIVD